MKLHFELMVITKVDTINDDVVTTRRIISKQSPCAIYSAPIAWIASDFLLAMSSIYKLCLDNTPIDNLFNTDRFTLLLWF